LGEDKQMKALVTGGAGFVGTNLIKRLLKDEHKVVSLDNYTTGLEKNEQEGCIYHNVDIRDAVDFDFFMEKPDVIFHLAALPRIQPSFDYPAITFEANVLGTMNILEWARKNNTPVVYAGSSLHTVEFIKIHIHLLNGKEKSCVKCIQRYMIYQLQYVDFIMCMAHTT